MATNVQRRAQTRGCLINAARHLFAIQGYADTRTEAILNGAGVTRGAMYHHFRNKTELFEAVCELLSQEAMAAIEQAVAGQHGSLHPPSKRVAWPGSISCPGRMFSVFW